ncbi:MAG: M48 family metalloprotease, partial [Planctomycetaceae bacterium]|nr:M48 family metalloprotease [Planctomycetaceae bacterium]
MASREEEVGELFVVGNEVEPIVDEAVAFESVAFEPITPLLPFTTESFTFEPFAPESFATMPFALEPIPEITPEPVTTQEPSPPVPSYWPLATTLRHWPLATMLAWFIAVLFLLARFALTQRRFAKMLRERRLIDDSRFYPSLPHQKRVTVYACENMATPAVCGFFRPMILIPEAMLEQLSDEQLRWVLLHELAHVRRCDLQTALVQRLAVILHFYNPVVWIASYCMNHLRESACDDLALAADTTISRKTIGDALLRIVEYSAAVPAAGRPIRGMLGLFDFAGSVRHRLRRLLDQKRKLHTKTGAASMTLIILMTVLLVPQWQAMPTASVPQTAENVIIADDDNNDVNTLQEIDKQPIIDANRETLEKILILSQQEVVTVDEAYKNKQTTYDQVLNAKFRHVEILYRLQTVLEEENFRVVEEYHIKTIASDGQLDEAERKLINTKVTLSKFISDNAVHFDLKTVDKERENLLRCYQRLLELAKRDYERVESFVAKGVATQANLRTLRQKVIDAEIAVANFQLQEAQRKNMIPTLPLANAEGSDSRVAPPAKSTSKFTPAEQGWLKAQYQQIVEQEDMNRKMIEAYYEEGDPKGNMVAFAEAQGKVIEARITLSTFLLNETDLTPQEYVRERQNLHSLYEELREAAKLAVRAATGVYQEGLITPAEVAQYERKLTEIEIALIRLFPEKETNQRPQTPVPTQQELKPPMPPGATTSERNPADDENLTISQQYAKASLDVAKAALQRSLGVNEQRPGTVTPNEIMRQQAEVIRAEMMILTAGPDFENNPEAKKKVQGYAEELRDMAQKDLIRAKQLHDDGFYNLAELNAATLNWIYAEVHFVNLSPDISEKEKREQTVKGYFTVHEIQKNAFLDAYARYQAGAADGTIVKLTEARYQLLASLLYLCHFCVSDPELTDEQRTEQITTLKYMYREQYIAAKIHADAVAELVRVGRMSKDEESKTVRLLEDAK